MEVVKVGNRLGALVPHLIRMIRSLWAVILYFSVHNTLQRRFTGVGTYTDDGKGGGYIYIGGRKTV